MSKLAPPKEPRQNVKFALFALSGNQCAFPDCDDAIFQDNSIVSQISHIHARATGGPRFNSELTDVEVHSLDNLMLLCLKHHKIVDDHPEKYSAEALRAMKKMHEASAQPTAPSSLHQLIESIAHQAVPEKWWQRPGLPRFRLHPGTSRPPNGEWTFDIELEQFDGEDVGDLRYSYVLGESSLDFKEPKPMRARKWRLQSLRFAPTGVVFELHLRFWWSGNWRTAFYHWDKEQDFQNVEAPPLYLPQTVVT